MATDSVSVDPDTMLKLHAISAATGDPMPVVLRHAVDAYERSQFLETLNREFAALRANPELWAEESKERAEWDVTLSDGQSQD